MRCRYCNLEISIEETRCARCHNRVDDQARRFAVVETAVAPDYYEAAEAPRRQVRLTAVVDNPHAERRAAPPMQPRLFPQEDGRRVVGLNEYLPPPPKQSRPRPEGQRPVRKRPVPGQGTFDFGPGPRVEPFSREINRQKGLPVAAMKFRTMAALFDAGFVFALTGLFLLTVRVCLGMLPVDRVFYTCYAAATLIIAAIYKGMYAFTGQATLGQQGARLRLISFDGHEPSRPQRMVRMVTGWLSLASASMGLLWAVVDQEHLTWHDHISQSFFTYDGEAPEDDED